MPRLFDGRPLWIGPVTPAAKPLIVRRLECISPETYRRRFFTVRHRFSDEEREAMTNLDGHVRFALGATVRDPAGNVEPVGIVLPENKPIIRLLTRYAPDPAILASGEHLSIDVNLAPNRHGAAA